MKSRGFTLLELLVVVAIVGLLAAVAVPQFERVIWKTRFVKGFLLAKQISAQVQVRALEWGRWPTGSEIADIMPAGFTYSSEHYDNGEGYVSDSDSYDKDGMSLYCADRSAQADGKPGFPVCSVIGVFFSGEVGSNMALLVNASPSGGPEDLSSYPGVCSTIKVPSDKYYNLSHSICKGLGGTLFKDSKHFYYL